MKNEDTWHLKGNFRFISSISLMAFPFQLLQVRLQLYPLYYHIWVFLQIGTYSSASKHAFLLPILKSNRITKFYNPNKASSSGPASLLKRVVPACGLPACCPCSSLSSSKIVSVQAAETSSLTNVKSPPSSSYSDSAIFRRFHPALLLTHFLGLASRHHTHFSHIHNSLISTTEVPRAHS